MPCTRPIQGWRCPESGKVTLSPKTGHRSAYAELPCGRCIDCRLNRAREWGIRAVHERQLHDDASYLTLTFSEDRLPQDRSIDVAHVQKFIRSLRKRTRRLRTRPNGELTPLRYLACGEYGASKLDQVPWSDVPEEVGLRPHYHLVVWGVDLRERFVKRTEAGHPLYRSSIVDAAWSDQGLCWVGDVTFQSSAYVAGYVTKKIYGAAADLQYTRIRYGTGECWDVCPEFLTMSKKPAIATGWLERYWTDVYPRDEVILGGKRMKPPKFYDRWLEANHPAVFEQVKKARRDEQYARGLKERTEERRAVRDEVTRARVSLFHNRASV